MVSSPPLINRFKPIGGKDIKGEQRNKGTHCFTKCGLDSPSLWQVPNLKLQSALANVEEHANDVERFVQLRCLWLSQASPTVTNMVLALPPLQRKSARCSPCAQF
jgi:hypothetical protein